MAISTISGSVTVQFNCTAQQNLPASSLQLQPAANSNTVGKKQAFKTGTGVNQATDAFLQFVTIAPSGSATVSLQALTDILQYTGLVLTKLKSIQLWLLSIADDATNGTNCSSVTVGNAASNPHPLFMTSGTMTFPLLNGQAIGTPFPIAAGIPVTGSQLNIFIQNNDGANSACVLLVGFGN